MTLDAATRRRYARQLLLGEIGEAGQARLLSARFAPGKSADMEAFSVAAEYLSRAGCAPHEEGDEVPVPDASSVMRFAGAESLRDAAAAVVGAFSAVEHLKTVLGIGEPRDFPSDVSMRGEI